MDKQIWSNFKKIRNKKGLSLKQVAKQIGINSSSLSRIENGKNPNVSFSTIYDLSRYYEVGLEKILSGDIDEEEDSTLQNEEENIITKKELPYYRVAKEAKNKGLSVDETRTIIQLFKKISATAQAANVQDEYSKIAYMAKSNGISEEKFKNMVDFMIRNEEVEDK